jgi:hypothetical protein
MESLVIKQNRIEQFVAQNPELLHPKQYATLFLIEREKDKVRFVVVVDCDKDDKLELHIQELGLVSDWDTRRRRRVVVPAEETL